MTRSSLGPSILGGAIIGLATLPALGCSKPCEPVTPSDTARRMGIVLEGARLCSEDRSVAALDYPDARGGEAVAAAYKTRLPVGGWKLETEAGGTMLFTREGDTLFIVTTDRTRERGVPYAAVRYCEDSDCRAELTALATAMKARPK